MAAGSDQRKLDLKDLPSLRRLGQGHSGYLYETEWGGNKCARKDFPLGSVELNRVFESEIQPLFDLDHPNIVKCFGYTLGKSSCSLVQEYVEENLQNTIQSRIEEQRKKSSRRTSTSTRVFDVDEIKRLVSSRGKKKETATTDEGSSRCPRPTPFEGPEAIAIISQIATGMKFLHDNQVVHGDLKPRNVLVYSESGERKVKLADFGLSETKEKITLVSERSRHVEKLTWKAPECLEEEEVLGHSILDLDKDSAGSGEEVGDFTRSKLAMADVYSFGLTCSYILGGKLMYPDMNLTKPQERSSIPKLPSACPEHLKLMIDSCLHFDPCSRPTFTIIFNRVAIQQYVTRLPTKTTTEDFQSKNDHEVWSKRPVYNIKVSSNVFPGVSYFHRKKTSSRSSTPPDSQSMMHHDGSSYKGVRYRKGHKWVAEIRPLRINIKFWLGTYSTAEEAACAYDVASMYFGSESSLNFEGNQIYDQIPRISTTDFQSLEFDSELRKVVKKYAKMAMESGIAAAAAAPAAEPQQEPEQENMNVHRKETSSRSSMPPNSKSMKDLDGSSSYKGVHKMAVMSMSESRSSDSGGSPEGSPGRLTSSNRRTYMCKVCGNVFPSGQSLGGHMNVHRKETSSRSSTPPDSSFQSSSMDHDGSSSSYKGVRYWKEQHKWVAEIRPPRASRTWWLGAYSTPKEAAYAYDVAIKYLGSENSLNFEGNQIYDQIPRISTDLQHQEYGSELRKVVRTYVRKLAMESDGIAAAAAAPAAEPQQQPEQENMVTSWKNFPPPFKPTILEYTPFDFEMQQAPESSHQLSDFDQADANYGLPGYGYQQQHHYNWFPKDE